MSSFYIGPEQLAAVVNSELNKFKDACEETVDNAAKTAAGHAADKLRSNSPGNGAYAPGWAVKQAKRARAGGYASVIVHNKVKPQLTHLLENGHAKVLWGHRTGGRVGPKVHIAPVESEAKTEFEALIRAGLK